MNFIPKKTKHKKIFKGSLYNQLYKTVNANSLFLGGGIVGLKAIESGVLTSKHFQAIKASIKKIIKKSGRVLFLNFPHIAKSQKPLEMRMGKGKGNIGSWVAKIQAGFILCEVNTINKNLAIKALATAKFRLPIKTKLVFNK